MCDVIVVGARCGGSPTALLLARRGYRVLLVDRGSFPSDTFRAHFVRAPGVQALGRWGLLGRVLATGCPPVRKRTTDFGDFPLSGYPPGFDDVPGDLAPRRLVLDRILVEAAVEAGAELRERFTVEELLWHDGHVVGVRGRTDRGMVTERARVVVGADGLHSTVARLAGSALRCSTAPLTFAYYTYWEGVPLDGIEIAYRVEDRRWCGAFPTNDGLTCVAVQGASSDFPAFKADVERCYHAALDLVPELARRVRTGRRVEPFRGSGDLPNFIRRAWGPGWALVGDASYHKDPLLAQGIADAFRDAELLAEAIDAGLGGARTLEESLAEYECRRDEAAVPGYERACRDATLPPFPPELLRLRAALRGNQADIDRFYGVEFGTVPREEFFAPANLDRILETAARA